MNLLLRSKRKPKVRRVTGSSLGRIIRDIRQSEKEEAAAARHYRTRAMFARRAGDEITAALYEHIAREEDAHGREFKQRRERVER